MDRESFQQMLDAEIDKAMGAMVPYGAGNVPHTRVRHWLETISTIAFNRGESYALMSLLTIEDVAERFGITPRRARAIAKNRNRRFGIGWQVPGTNQWLFRPSEMDTLTPDKKYQRKDRQCR